MGLLDFLPQMDEHQKRGLLMAAAQMMQAKGNFGNGAGAGLMGYVQGSDASRALADRRAEEAQQRQLRQAQLDTMTRANTDRAATQNAFQVAFGDNPNLVKGDDEGNPMPQVPYGGGMQQFLRQAGQHMDPMQAASLMQKQGPMKIGKDDRLVDPQTFREVLPPSPPQPDKPPAGYSRGPNGQLTVDPNWLETQMKLRQAGAPKVTVDNRLENKEAAEQGALNVKNYGDLANSANVARRENALLSGIEKMPLKTNALTPANVTVSSWIAALGGGERFKDVAAQGQGFTSFAKDLVLQRQLAQKGPQTESDARRLEATVAQLGNEDNANKLIINFSKAANDRTIAQEKFFREYYAKKKTYQGAEAAWYEGEGGKSLWEDPRLKKFQSSGGTIDFSQLPPGR